MVLRGKAPFADIGLPQRLARLTIERQDRVNLFRFIRRRQEDTVAHHDRG